MMAALGTRARDRSLLLVGRLMRIRQYSERSMKCESSVMFVTHSILTAKCKERDQGARGRGAGTTPQQHQQHAPPGPQSARRGRNFYGLCAPNTHPEHTTRGALRAGAHPHAHGHADAARIHHRLQRSAGGAVRRDQHQEQQGPSRDKANQVRTTQLVLVPV